MRLFTICSILVVTLFQPRTIGFYAREAYPWGTACICIFELRCGVIGVIYSDLRGLNSHLSVPLRRHWLYENTGVSYLYFGTVNNALTVGYSSPCSDYYCLVKVSVAIGIKFRCALMEGAGLCSRVPNQVAEKISLALWLASAC